MTASGCHAASKSIRTRLLVYVGLPVAFAIGLLTAFPSSTSATDMLPQSRTAASMGGTVSNTAACP